MPITGLLSTLGDAFDDVSPCAFDDGHDLGPLGRRDANLSSVCATSFMNASHSPGVMRRCRCELSMSLPVYLCGPPAAQHSISVTDI